MSVCLGLLAFSSAGYAKTSDADQPLNIEADSVEIREKDGTSIYKGQVKISRGSLKISGDLIFVHTINNKLNKIRVEGKPARFSQLNDLDQEISAESHKMEYLANTGRLTLKEKAVLVQNHNRFSSEHIIYDTRKDIVQAGDSPDPDNTSEDKPKRVMITIHPEKSEPDPAPAQDNNQQQ